jgi:homoserine dehydrogenase
LRVVLLGLGVVGRGVYERLKLYPERFSVEKILVRHPQKHIGSGVPAALLTTEVAEMAGLSCDLVVEALGAGEPALALLFTALASGKPVVTANKANVAAEWQRLRPYLQGETPALRCSAAVGGAVPILEVIQTLRQQSPVARVRAVLNGTCNYVLERLHEGSSYHAALNEARAHGFAEADPHLDVSGLDAAAKLRLVALQAFDSMPSTLDCQGIAGLSPATLDSTRPARLVHKLVATLTTDHGRVVGRVAPELLPADDFLAGARFEHNRCEIELKSGARLQLHGRGAGRWPTATAVMGDVWSVARSAHG